MDHTHVDDDRLIELSATRCWELVASQPVGRLAWNGAKGPTVIPVNFTVVGSTLQLRTAAWSVLARECDDSPVSFEVDHLDPRSRTGWSVLLRGWAHLDYAGSGSEGRSDAGQDVDVWAGGARELGVVIEVDDATGRQIGLPGWEVRHRLWWEVLEVEVRQSGPELFLQ